MSTELDEKILEPFRDIFAAMNISDDRIELSAKNFSLPELTEFERDALSEGMPIDPKFLTELMKNLSPTGCYVYKDHVVVVYLRDQYLTRENYERGNYNRFHLCFCQALRTAKKHNRYEARFVMTYDTSGNFLVNLFVDGQPREQNVYRRLKVCQYCLRELNWKNFRRYCGGGRTAFLHGNKSIRRKIVDEFDIAEFLLTAQKNKADFPPVDFTDVSAVKKVYDLTAQIKAALKNVRYYTCEVCRKKFSPEELEIHHRNHNQGDNRHDNLMVLCRDCHKKIHTVEGGMFVKRNKRTERADALKIRGDIYSALHDEQSAKKFYRAAMNEYQKNLGDLDSLFELVNVYLCERKTFTAAQKCFQKYLSQAKNGTIKEYIRSGLIYAKGLGVSKNLPKAQKFFAAVRAKGSEKIFIDSEFIELAYLVGEVETAKRLHAQATEIFESAAAGGSIQAVVELVKLYGNKNFVSDFDDAIKNFFDEAQKIIMTRLD